MALLRLGFVCDEQLVAPAEQPLHADVRLRDDLAEVIGEHPGLELDLVPDAAALAGADLVQGLGLLEGRASGLQGQRLVGERSTAAADVVAGLGEPAEPVCEVLVQRLGGIEAGPQILRVWQLQGLAGGDVVGDLSAHQCAVSDALLDLRALLRDLGFAHREGRDIRSGRQPEVRQHRCEGSAGVLHGCRCGGLLIHGLDEVVQSAGEAVPRALVEGEVSEGSVLGLEGRDLLCQRRFALERGVRAGKVGLEFPEVGVGLVLVSGDLLPSLLDLLDPRHLGCQTLFLRALLGDVGFDRGGCPALVGGLCALQGREPSRGGQQNGASLLARCEQFLKVDLAGALTGFGRLGVLERTAGRAGLTVAQEGRGLHGRIHGHRLLRLLHRGGGDLLRGLCGGGFLHRRFDFSVEVSGRLELCELFLQAGDCFLHRGQSGPRGREFLELRRELGVFGLDGVEIGLPLLNSVSGKHLGRMRLRQLCDRGKQPLRILRRGGTAPPQGRGLVLQRTQCSSRGLLGPRQSRRQRMLGRALMGRQRALCRAEIPLGGRELADKRKRPLCLGGTHKVRLERLVNLLLLREGFGVGLCLAERVEFLLGGVGHPHLLSEFCRRCARGIAPGLQERPCLGHQCEHRVDIVQRERLRRQLGDGLVGCRCFGLRAVRAVV